MQRGNITLACDVTIALALTFLLVSMTECKCGYGISKPKSTETAASKIKEAVIADGYLNANKITFEASHHRLRLSLFLSFPSVK